MTKASDNAFPSILITEGTEPSAPAAGKQRLYIDSTSHKLKATNSSGTERDIEGIANPMTTAGDVIYGGASGVPTRLAVGTAGQVLKVNSGATAPEWGAGGSTVPGNVLIVMADGWDITDTGGGANNTADSAHMQPLKIPGQMLVRELLIRCTSSAAGSVQWGLFDYSSSLTACTKLAGGSGALGSAAWVSIAASGAPVTVAAGNYMLIVKQPAATPPSIRRGTAIGTGIPLGKGFAAYTWDDTPDITSGSWSDTQQPWHMILVGDLNGSTQW